MYILFKNIVPFLQQLNRFSKETMIQSPAVGWIDGQPNTIIPVAHGNTQTLQSTPYSPGQTADSIGTQINSKITKSDVDHDPPATLKSLKTHSTKTQTTRTTRMTSKSQVVANCSSARVPPRTRKRSQDSKESQPSKTATAKRTRYSRAERK